MYLFSRHFLLTGICVVSLGTTHAFEVLTSWYDIVTKTTTVVYPIDFGSSTATTNQTYQYGTWTAPNGPGLKYFDISPYVPQGKQCIEVSWRNTGSGNALIPDFIAYVNTSAGWQILADDNNTTVLPNAIPGTGSRLPAFRISGDGYLGGTWLSYVRISSFNSNSANNAGFAQLRIRYRHDLTQAQCESDGNWPVVRMGPQQYPVIIPNP